MLTYVMDDHMTSGWVARSRGPSIILGLCQQHTIRVVIRTRRSTVIQVDRDGKPARHRRWLGAVQQL